MRLFDDIQRTDPRPAEYGEDSFSFLNRVGRPFWETVRAELERWFAEYPAAHAADLRARFRSADPAQHWPAWWELYLFRVFKRLGFAPQVHPEVSGTTTHPDFLMTRNGDSFYVEAVTVFSGIVEEGRDGRKEAWILDLIDEAHSPNFFVGIDFERVGTTRPRRTEVTRPVERWLASLNPDEVSAAHNEQGSLPELELPFRDWLITLEAIPVKPEARGDPRIRGQILQSRTSLMEPLSRGDARLQDLTPCAVKDPVGSQ